MKDVNTHNFWTFELRSQEGANILTRNIVGFIQKDRQQSQILNNGSFYKPRVTNNQCIIGTDNCTDSGIMLYYIDDDYSQGKT